MVKNWKFSKILFIKLTFGFRLFTFSFQAYLELLADRKRFHLSHPINAVSNVDVPGVNTILINVRMKFLKNLSIQVLFIFVFLGRINSD